MMWVAQCKHCHSQQIVPHAEKTSPPAYTMVRFYCTNCGKAYNLTELVELYVAV